MLERNTGEALRLIDAGKPLAGSQPEAMRRYAVPLQPEAYGKHRPSGTTCDAAGSPGNAQGVEAIGKRASSQVAGARTPD
ncbi:MAG: hypothetical protein IPH35_18730 [Rhodoferax sp.]|nr:hypothetical protein [Rhodoferax sp.]